MVEYREAGFKAQGFDLGANNSQAEVVKGGDGEAFAICFAQQAADAGFHFPGGFIGEGHGGNIARGDAAVFYQVGDFLGDYAGFATAGTGQY